MYLQNVMVEILQERKNYLKNKKEEKRKCVQIGNVEVPQEAFLSVIEIG